MCTFLTEKGCMRCLRTPMGLSVSSDEFLARCYVIFEGIPKIVMLIDDILIQAESLPELLFIMRLTLDSVYRRVRQISAIYLFLCGF